MGANPCECEGRATEAVRVSEGFAFVPGDSFVPVPGEALALILVLATVALALARQRRRGWCVRVIRDAERASRSAAASW